MNFYVLTYQMCRECAITLIKVPHFMKVLADVKTALEIGHDKLEMEF